METSLNIVQIILSIVLITVILIQVRGSAGNLFGGGESSFRTRRGVDLVLFRFTIFVGVLFLLGLMSAAYSSADSALTSLTTCLYVDFLGLEKDVQKERLISKRTSIHILVSVLLFAVILTVNQLNNNSIISTLFLLASFTYGPLLGLFMFGLFTTRKVVDRLVPIVVILAPLFSYILYRYDVQIFNGFDFGPDLLIVNGLITCFLLLLISNKENKSVI